MAHIDMPPANSVSMESGLEGRNNTEEDTKESADCSVSMESGLEGRNNNKCFVVREIYLITSQWSPA